jgi:predicted dienelactone hydrolase
MATRPFEKCLRPLAGAFAALLLGCSAAAGVTPASTVATQPAAERAYKLAEGPYQVQTVPQFLLHDAKRDKDLPVSVSYPKGKGPFPVIIFSHGAGGSGSHYFPLVRFWVSHGYVCVCPTHADSLSLRKDRLPITQPSDVDAALRGVVRAVLADTKGWENRPRDISFVIDSLGEIEAKDPNLKHLMDTKRIGVGGHSYGAYTAQVIGGATVDIPGGPKGQSLADDRAKAILVLSGQGRDQMGLTGKSWEKCTRPMMVMTGTLDRGATGKGADWKLEPFRFAPAGDKYGINIEGAHHFSFSGRIAEGGGVWLAPRAQLDAARAAGTDEKGEKAVFSYVKIATIAFWDAYLCNDEKAKAYLKSDSLPTYSNSAVKLERR